MEETIWALAPAVIAIVLALLTKEVYISLFVGILSGALFFTGFQVIPAVQTTFEIMGERVGSNINILIFLVLLGIIVALMTKSGASRAYGNWASRAIKTQRGALFATAGLGALIFVDDYFNCLTVGTVMRPVTDRHNIKRTKLAYIIDATAAPVCIIAPISSWAAAVGSSLPESSTIDGFSLFIQTIPFNFYAILTLAMVVFIIALNFDFGAMKRVKETIPEELREKEEQELLEAKKRKQGRVFDLLIPIVCLIGFCIFFMLYTGGIFEGQDIAGAFANCDSALSLVMGSFFAIIVIALLYLPRKIISFREFAESFVHGFKAMVPAILILTLAWTLSGVCGEEYLNAGAFVSQVVTDSNMATAILPPIFFLVATGLAFATGTSWGTFGILIPIAIAIFSNAAGQEMVLTIAAILAGAVCGDHISPISDTTILASTGADCNHIDHVSTQLPYALLVALCCVVAYVIAGLTGNGWVALAIGLAMLLIILTALYKKSKKQSARQID